MASGATYPGIRWLLQSQRFEHLQELYYAIQYPVRNWELCGHPIHRQGLPFECPCDPKPNFWRWRVFFSSSFLSLPLIPMIILTHLQYTVTSQGAGFGGQPNVGILGLAFSLIASTRQPNIIANLISAGLLINPVFSFYLTRGQTMGSQLSLGAVDRTKYTGAVTYTPVVSQTYWQVQSRGFAVNGNLIAASFGAAIDTGTTYVNS